MKWDNIKNKCINIAYQEWKQIGNSPENLQLYCMKLGIEKERTTNASKEVSKLFNEIQNIINNWDIRMWESLQKLYPKAFNKNITSIEYREKGWELI